MHRLQGNICKSDKGVVFRIYKALCKLNSKNTNNPVRKCSTDLNRHFTKKDIRMLNKHMKIYTPSLATREVEIEGTIRYHHISIRMVNYFIY